jgi:protein-disulfide isomerase
MRILLVEDDPVFADGLRLGLLVDLCRRPSGDVHLSRKSRSTSPFLAPSSAGLRDRAASKLRRIAACATVSLLVLSTLVGSRAAQSEELRLPFTSEQRQAIGEVVREYLLQNPEVLRDASIELERRSDQLQKEDQAKALKKYWSQLISPRGSTIIGNPNGRINLVAFFDYNCPFCRASVDDIQKLIDDNPELRVVLREFPILGQNSTDTSRIALAVARETAEPAMRARYYTSLMKTKGQMKGTLALSMATELGLDGARLKSDLKNPDIDVILRENYSLAEALGINGTPAFIIGDQVIVGAVGPERMQAAISTASK